MSLTRRSFVKKSAYSAAAVTVLGTGVGLGQTATGQKEVTDYIDLFTSQDVTGEGVASGDEDKEDEIVAAAKLAAMQDLTINALNGQSNIVTKMIENDHELKSITSISIPADPPNIDGLVEVSVITEPLAFNRIKVTVIYKLRANLSTRTTYNYGPK
ncbi:MAG: twin-arginine translocation signal domain-containing protein [Akkermansiaceae bacterium]